MATTQLSQEALLEHSSHSRHGYNTALTGSTARTQLSLKAWLQHSSHRKHC